MINVVIVDDSPEYRKALCTTLEFDEEIIVIGNAANGEPMFDKEIFIV
jgi:chemotaxis response regulator CheB